MTRIHPESEPEKFADPMDRATAEQERELEFALRRQREAAAVTSPLAPKGFCHDCEEPVAAGLRFCDDTCRDSYEYLQKRKRANGR